jgi:hypothetical protein
MFIYKKEGDPITPDPEIRLSIGHETLSDGFYVIAPFTVEEFKQD